MAAPTLLSTYPANNDVGIPTGSSIMLDFSNGIDVTTIKDFIVLYGADSDQTSGPDGMLWMDADTGDNPFFLRSPGFKGLVDIQTTIVYYDIDTGEDLGSLEATAEADELAYGAQGAGHRVYVVPAAGHFAADLEYTLHILGDPDVQGTGVSSRTVFDTVPDPGNSSDTGVVVCTGGYTGVDPQTVVVEVTDAGDIGTAKYRWYYEDAGVGTAVYDKLTNRRYRTVAHGIKIRFTGEGFAAGDIFRIAVEPPQRLAASTKVVFTTNDGSYTAAPDSPATPATSTPPAATIPAAPGTDTSDSYLQVEEMSPADGSYNIARKTREITILFSETLDATTITADTVRVFKYPVLGSFTGQPAVVELQKKLTVSGQTLTIEI